MKVKQPSKLIKWYVVFEILDSEIEETLKIIKASKKLKYLYSWKGNDWNDNKL